MNKTNKITISLILVLCLVFPSVAGILYFANKNLKEKSIKNTDFVSAGAVASQFTTYSKEYSKNDFVLSENSENTTELASNVQIGTLLNYSTSLKNDDSSKINVKLVESITSTGNLKDIVYINDYIIGEIEYDENKNISSFEINYNNVYYNYQDENISSFTNNGLQFDYEYASNMLSKVYYDDELFAKYSYTDYARIQTETYYTYQRIFEQTNIATLEYAYNPQTDTKILARTYDYINDNPYKVVKEEISYKGTNYQVVKSVEYDGEIIEFEYNHFYNNKPYITHVKTGKEEYSLSYMNDMLLTKFTDNEISTFVYSSSGDLIGMVYGKIVDSVFNYMFFSFISDGFGNIIEANYVNIDQRANDFNLSLEKLYEQQFDSVGHKIFQNTYSSNITTNFGFGGGMEFKDFDLVYINGKLYSPLLSDCLQNYSDSTYSTRLFLTNTSKHKDPTKSTVEKGVAIESLQAEIVNILDTSSVSGLSIKNSEMTVGIADVFTLPVDKDQNNMLRYPSKVFFLANLDDSTEVNNYKTFIAKYFNQDTDSYVVMDEYYLASLSTKDLNYQFIFNNKLFTIKYVEPGLYGYSVQTDYSSKNYLDETNIINYDTGRYVTYYKSTIDIDNYIDNISFLANFSSTEEVNSYFETLGFINTSIGETYQSVNYGDNSEFVKNLIKNTCSLKLPEYDKEKQYVSVDENGNYVVKDIPEDAKVEDAPTKINYQEIIDGITKVVQGVILVASAVTLVVANCAVGISVICGYIALAGGLVVTVCGIAEIRHGATGYSWLVDDVMNGDMQLLETVSSIASTVATIALIVGSITLKTCFVADTKLTTQQGIKNIQDIKVGDYVLSYNPETGTQSYNKVVDCYSRTVNQLCDVGIGGNITTSTISHPYFANGEWVQAKDLKPGDNVLQSNGDYATIESVRVYNTEPTTVYNLNVENDHTYYANDVLVHNACANQFMDDSTNELYKSKEFQSTMQEFKSKYPDVNFNDKAAASKFWKNHRVQFNKSLGKKLLYNDQIGGQVKNLNLMIEKGNNPIIKLSNGNITRLQYHHYYGKMSGNMFNVYPMSANKHMTFHNMYGRNDPTRWQFLAKAITNLT